MSPAGTERRRKSSSNKEPQWVAIPPYMYKMLAQWADGKVDNERKLEVLSVPEALDKAALEYCLADAFHPGCEVTWPIRHASMFMGRFRLLHRSPQDPEPDYGEQLEPTAVYDGGWAKPTSFYGVGTPGGPLWGQRAGDLTRWMAVPWGKRNTRSPQTSSSFTAPRISAASKRSCNSARKRFGAAR